MIELARQYGRYGYRRIAALLRDAGWQVNASLPTPPFTPEEKEAVAAEVYTHVWQQAVRGEFAMAA